MFFNARTRTIQLLVAPTLSHSLSLNSQAKSPHDQNGNKTDGAAERTYLHYMYAVQ